VCVCMNAYDFPGSLLLHYPDPDIYYPQIPSSFKKKKKKSRVSKIRHYSRLYKNKKNLLYKQTRRMDRLRWRFLTAWPPPGQSFCPGGRPAPVGWIPREILQSTWSLNLAILCAAFLMLYTTLNIKKWATHNSKRGTNFKKGETVRSLPIDSE